MPRLQEDGKQKNKADETSTRHGANAWHDRVDYCIQLEHVCCACRRMAKKKGG